MISIILHYKSYKRLKLMGKQHFLKSLFFLPLFQQLMIPASKRIFAFKHKDTKVILKFYFLSYKVSFDQFPSSFSQLVQLKKVELHLVMYSLEFANYRFNI